MAFPVKWFASDMQGAPSLGDTTEGALTALLKACLVTGFGNLTINALAWDATEGAAKATISVGHTYLTDSVIAVSGASPSAYNGEHRVKKVSSTEVWFELDAGNPGMAASGTLSMKVAALGWTITHESPDGKTFIVRSPELVDAYPVSLRIDNTAWSGWTGPNPGTIPMYLAKVMLVEDVVDINTYTLIYEHRWPATKRYSDGRWDLVGDNLLFYFLPAYGTYNRQVVYLFGYIKSLRPGDRYHALLTHYYSTAPVASASDSWSVINSVNTTHNSTLAFDDSNHRRLARAFSQLFGSTTWWLKGLFGFVGTGMNVPNGPDNAFYLSTDPVMVMENGNHLRGYLPGLLVPFASPSAWTRKNFSGLPAYPGKIVRFIFSCYSQNGTTAATLMGLDLTGPWR